MCATNYDNSYDAPFPTRLRFLLKENHVSQQALADYVDVKRQTISAYASGNVEPTLSKLVGIAQYFGKSVDYLVGGHECETPDNQKIYERLGLCDEAISSLEMMQKNPEQWGWALDAINDILGCQEGHEALRQIDQYLYADFKAVYPSSEDGQLDKGSPIRKLAVSSMHTGNPAITDIKPKVLKAGFLQAVGDSLDVLRRGISDSYGRKGEEINEQAREQ
jgi:transcriptional regulator with XRE-family HTH domain